MLTPFKVMLGIGPPGENWPFTLSGLSALLRSVLRSVWPRESMSGRLIPELSQCWLHSPFHSPSGLPQVPTPLPPGLPPLGLNPGLLHLLQPWQVATHWE